MKQLKKLTLKKEVISNLNESEMNQLKGGDSVVSLAAQMAGLPCVGCGGIGGSGGILCPTPGPTPTPTPTPLGTQPDGGQAGCQNYTIGCPSVGCTTFAWQNC